mmetsp:Transcript_20896/g.42653  ORF Transcript_20896/g.42653 Transcript_20896/m.42653 type:complete len:236 (-) Transcript_20896:1510-2217(-)
MPPLPRSILRSSSSSFCALPGPIAVVAVGSKGSVNVTSFCGVVIGSTATELICLAFSSSFPALARAGTSTPLVFVASASVTFSIGTGIFAAETRTEDFCTGVSSEREDVRSNDILFPRTEVPYEAAKLATLLMTGTEASDRAGSSSDSTFSTTGSLLDSDWGTTSSSISSLAMTSQVVVEAGVEGISLARATATPLLASVFLRKAARPGALRDEAALPVFVSKLFIATANVPRFG